MCGIAGFFGAGEFADLKRMCDAQRHRGPDAEGFYSDPDIPLHLGHRRLSIIDLTTGGQPMWTSDGQLGIVFNGEIYNHLELRRELTSAGHRFVTDHSDTEVLLHGYREWGNRLPERLNGMWAFALYDRSAKTLFCSRDRFGKKPFFYTRQPGLFAFASELTALTAHSAIDPRLSPIAVKKFFAYGYVPAPLSIYAGIFKLPGGHNLAVNLGTGEMRVEKYWDFILEPFAKIPADPIGEWGEEIRRLLFQAVKRRLMSDVPLGIFLSGGMDSTAISAFAARASGSEKVKAFSIGFTEKSFDESRYASLAAKTFGLEHHIETLSMETGSRLLPEVLGNLDEPMADSSILPTSLLCGVTRKGVTVALGGDGGDELFAGYNPFLALPWAERYAAAVPTSLHRLLKRAAEVLPVSHANFSVDFKIKRFLAGLDHAPMFRVPSWMSHLDARSLEDLFHEPVSDEELYSETKALWDDCPQDDIVDKTLQYFTKLYLQDDILVKVDRASMMHSLEVRAPFLDIELVDFVRRIPWQYKFHRGETKYLLKKALEPVIPHEIIYRGKKGFGIPVGKWIADGRLECPIGDDVYGRYFRRLLAEHRSLKKDHRLALWAYTVFQRFQARRDNQ